MWRTESRFVAKCIGTRPCLLCKPRALEGRRWRRCWMNMMNEGHEWNTCNFRPFFLCYEKAPLYLTRGLTFGSTFSSALNLPWILLSFDIRLPERRATYWTCVYYPCELWKILPFRPGRYAADHRSSTLWDRSDLDRWHLRQRRMVETGVLNSVNSETSRRLTTFYAFQTFQQQ